MALKFTQGPMRPMVLMGPMGLPGLVIPGPFGPAFQIPPPDYNGMQNKKSRELGPKSTQSSWHENF